MKRSLALLALALMLLVNVAVGADSPDVAATRQKAEAGDATAQYSLGLMYYNGEGVPKDSAEAVKWYRKAADQGYADAQFNLGLNYANGEGVPKVAKAVCVSLQSVYNWEKRKFKR